LAVLPERKLSLGSGDFVALVVAYRFAVTAIGRRTEREHIRGDETAAERMPFSSRELPLHSEFLNMVGKGDSRAV